ncbi:MAG: GldG family protein [Candidatus Eutrophobiaceae bacterium]
MHRTVRKNLLSGTSLLLMACLFVSSTILVNTHITNQRIDLTENRLFTLSEGTLDLLRRLEEPIILDFYFSQRALLDYPQLAHHGVRVRDMLWEYVSHSNDQLILNILDPEPFSELEDQALVNGLQSMGDDATERAWFGLVGTNSTDDEKIIPFFNIGRETALEYDLSKLIYFLAFPEKPVITVTSGVPAFGNQEQGQEAWSIILALREFFEVRDLGTRFKDIDHDTDVLLIIHPKNFSDIQYYAIEQYLLRGGKAILFIDPLAERDPSPPPAVGVSTLPQLNSNFNTLLQAWGITINSNELVADLKASMRVQSRSTRGAGELIYLPWMSLDRQRFNLESLITSQLATINMGTAGHIESSNAKLRMEPLLQTLPEAMLFPRDLVLFQPDPNTILNNFESTNKRYTLAARIQGQVDSVYPEGRPAETESQRETSNHRASGAINIILVSDTDILSDNFWIRPQQVAGKTVNRPISNNADFVINAVESLAGGGNLSTLRTRDKFSRPFTRVEELSKQAETQFRKKELILREKLTNTEAQLRTLQQEHETSDAHVLSPELLEELEKYRNIRLQTRQELRAVQHELRKNIEQLGSRLRAVNILLMPLLVACTAILIGFMRTQRRKRNRKLARAGAKA